jgi:RNA polymerase sigma-70 factor (ECF subfamily)
MLEGPVRNREDELAEKLRAALKGDDAAYRSFLSVLATAVRPVVRATCARAGLPPADVEDMVQDVLLAVHTKRHTWDTQARLAPWVHAIVRYKVIDGFRRRGRRIEVPIDDVIETLAGETAEPEPSVRDILERYTGALKGRQYEVVKSISLDHASIRQTAERLSMTEGAVRVTLHRAVAALARAYRNSTT